MCMLKLKHDELFDEEALAVICEIFPVNADDITDITVLKKE